MVSRKSLTFTLNAQDDNVNFKLGHFVTCSHMQDKALFENLKNIEENLVFPLEEQLLSCSNKRPGL